tara:strand:+ start:6257 stop:7072 length:816 start_codon:yes stop_codon:yes gene_type:complete
MLDRTKEIRYQMLQLDDSFERLKCLHNRYEDQTAYVLAPGPSLGNHDVQKLKDFLSDKFVVGIKQMYDLYSEVTDIHLMNFDNYKDYEYNDSTIACWIVYMPNHAPYIIQNDIRCDFMMPLTRNWGSYETTIAAQRDFESLLIERSFERPWGAGIMYESGLPIPLYTGCKKIITIGWDIGVLKKEDEGKKHIRYDHFYAKGKDGEKTAYDGINVKKMPVGGSAGMSYEDTKRVIDSTEDLHKFMESIGVDFSICSTINQASDKIKRIELDV